MPQACGLRGVTVSGWLLKCSDLNVNSPVVLNAGLTGLGSKVTVMP